MKIKTALITFFCFLFFTSHSQFILGWNGGYASARELNKEVYIYDQINKSGLKKEMHPIHWYQGPSIGFRFADDKVFGEILYSWKGIKSSAKFDSANVPMMRQLKVYQYTFNYGFGIKKNAWAFGFSFDFGRFKGKGKRGTEAEIKSKGYDVLWKNKNPFGLLSLVVPYRYTIFTEYNFSSISIRFYYQLTLIKTELGKLDSWLFQSYLNYGELMTDQFSSFGCMISLRLGKK